VENPFDDIVPRITAAEKRAQQRAREEAQNEREEAERRKGAKKYVRTFSASDWRPKLNFSQFVIVETSSF
jgi:peptidyl-prolyl cis-trans isomerase SDCCAG10